jgi:sulfatase maturation enzyme AslB (radical SAM superfamily)
VDWQTFAEQLTLSAGQEPAVKAVIAAAKDAFAEVCQHRAISGAEEGDGDRGISPLELIVAQLRRLPQPAEAEVAARFFAFLAAERDNTTGLTFAAACGEIDGAARGRLREHLDAAQQDRLSALAIDSLIDVATGYDPLADQVRRCLLSGEEPAEAAGGESGADAEPKYRGLFCPQPFEYAQVEPDGSLYLCCPQTLPQPVGNVGRGGLLAAWNSDQAAKVRASILDGTYRYCSERTCGLLQQRLLRKVEEVTDPFHREIIDGGLTRLARGPSTLNLSYDRTCNLACPSCRTGLIVLRGEARQRAAVIHEQVMGEPLRDARRLIVTGSGDPFASHFYLQFLRTFEPESAPAMRIQLSTNGVLLTPEMWGSICRRAIDWIDVSVDAATPETYALNRGGNFARLMENLAFLKGLRAAGEISLFQLHFVVQENNYREMAAFAELGLALGCDKVCFKQLVNWGTFSTGEFHRRAVQRPEHPEHGLFLAALSQPIFRHPKVYLHDLGKVHQALFGAPAAAPESHWIVPS